MAVWQFRHTHIGGPAFLALLEVGGQVRRCGSRGSRRADPALDPSMHRSLAKTPISPARWQLGPTRPPHARVATASRRSLARRAGEPSIPATVATRRSCIPIGAVDCAAVELSEMADQSRFLSGLLRNSLRNCGVDNACPVFVYIEIDKRQILMRCRRFVLTRRMEIRYLLHAPIG